MRETAVMHSLTAICRWTGAIAVVLAVGSAAAAQESASDDEIARLKMRVDGFFRQLAGTGNNGPDAAGAIRDLVASGPLKDRTQEIDKLVEQAQALRDPRYGAYTGHEAVGARAVGSDLVFLRYLYKAERYPVVWYFTFYRATTAGGFKSDWTLISLRFDTKIEALDR